MDSSASDLPSKPEANRLYRRVEDLPASLWTDLAVLDPKTVCGRTGATFLPGQGYSLLFLNINFTVSIETRTILDPSGSYSPDFQLGLVLINYLLCASETGLSGRMVTARELNGGELFFKGPHALRTTPVLEKFGEDPEAFIRRIERFGGAAIPGGDASSRFLVLPKILVGYTLYAGDDEFPASLTITFDASTDKHLPLDAIWAMINVVSELLASGGEGG